MKARQAADPWTAFRRLAEAVEPIANYGRATQVVGLVVEGQGPRAAVGDICHIETRDQKRKIPAEVVGFRDRKILLMPFGKNQGIEPGCRIIPAGISGPGPGGPRIFWAGSWTAWGIRWTGAGPRPWKKPYPC